MSTTRPPSSTATTADAPGWCISSRSTAVPFGSVTRSTRRSTIRPLYICCPIRPAYRLAGGKKRGGPGCPRPPRSIGTPAALRRAVHEPGVVVAVRERVAGERGEVETARAADELRGRGVVLRRHACVVLAALLGRLVRELTLGARQVALRLALEELRDDGRQLLLAGEYDRVVGDLERIVARCDRRRPLTEDLTALGIEDADPQLPDRDRVHARSPVRRGPQARRFAVVLGLTDGLAVILVGIPVDVVGKLQRRPTHVTLEHALLPLRQERPDLAFVLER